MDPYQTLSVPRDCTRDEVKAAFRTRSWDVHPDHGGDEGAFIRLCEAYKQVLADLDQLPLWQARKPARVRRRSRTATPKPPDPNWEPELVISGQPPGYDRPPTPPDPNWEPELVVLDNPTPSPLPPRPGDAGVAGYPYASWLQDLGARSAHAEHVARSRPGRPTALVTILAWIVIAGLLCCVAWKALEQ